MKRAIISILLLATPLWAANDFSTDPELSAIYNFESGALGTDSSGLSNTLTVSGVGDQTGTYQQGSCCGDWNPNDYMVRTHASGFTNFPGKTASADLSVGVWVYTSATPTSGNYYWIAAVYKDGNNSAWILYLTNDSGTLKWGLAINNSGGGASSALRLTPSNAIAAGRWYHVAATHHVPTKAYKVRAYDVTNDTVDENAGTSTIAMVSCTWNFEVGYSSSYGNYADLYLDELILCTDVWSSAEIDEIRAGTYDGPAAAGSGNIFTGDPNCVSLWSHESGALTTDSVGTNTLTGTSPTADTAFFREKVASGDYEAGSSQRLKRADSSLSADTPLKSGTTNKTLSICAWFCPESVSTNHTIIAKQYTIAGEGWWEFSLFVNAGQLSLCLGYGGGLNESEFKNQAITWVNGQWYHVGVTYEDSSKSWTMRLYDETADTVYNSSGTTTSNINMTAMPWSIGSQASDVADTYYFDGWIDEVVMFDDILTSDEIDLIRRGLYGSDPTVNMWWWRRRHSE